MRMSTGAHLSMDVGGGNERGRIAWAAINSKRIHPKIFPEERKSRIARRGLYGAGKVVRMERAD